MICARYYIAASVVFIGSVAYAARAAQHGDMIPTYVAVVLHGIYASVFLADALISKRRDLQERNESRFNERKDRFVHRLNRRAF